MWREALKQKIDVIHYAAAATGIHFLSEEIQREPSWLCAHLVQMHQEGDVGSQAGGEDVLPGGQSQAFGGPVGALLLPGRIHVLYPFGAVVGDHLPIPLGKNKKSVWERRVSQFFFVAASPVWWWCCCVWATERKGCGEGDSLMTKVHLQPLRTEELQFNSTRFSEFVRVYTQSGQDES